MGPSMDIVIDGKLLTILAKSFILDLLTGVIYECASGKSKVKCNLKVKFAFDTRVLGKVNTNAKMKKSEYCKKDVVSGKSM